MNTQNDTPTDDTVFKELMKFFKPYAGFEVEDYYGVSLLKIKKNGTYSIKLLYDYDKHALASNPLSTDSLDKALQVYALLDSKAKNKDDKFHLDTVIDTIKSRRDNLVW